jgi:uncharacterized OB-fold protein
MVNTEGPLLQFREFLKQGKFMLQRARSSSAYVFYPRVLSPGAGAEDLEWVPASGKGTVYASTIVYPRKKAAYNIAVVELAEGPRLMSRVVDISLDEIQIGMSVIAKIENTPKSPEGDETWTLVFTPDQAGQATTEVHQ